MNKYETTIKGKHITVDFEATVNRTAKSCFVCIQFNTKEESLLNTILHKYIYEKCLGVGVNSINNIYSAIYGSGCIVLLIPEAKITQNILLLFNYIAKTTLDRKLKDKCGQGNYNTLEKETKHFTVLISGKCKNFIASLKNKANKINQMIKGLDLVEFKTRDSFKSEKALEPTIITMDSSSTKTMMYLSIILNNIPCEINKEGSKIKIKFYDSVSVDNFKNLYLNSNVFQYRVKHFLTQSGNVGRPSSNDKGGTKYKEKIRMLKDSQQMITKIFSNVRGFEYDFKDVEEYKKVDRDALTPILRHKF